MGAFVERTSIEIRLSLELGSTVFPLYKGIWTQGMENKGYCQPLSTVGYVVNPLVYGHVVWSTKAIVNL